MYLTTPTASGRHMPQDESWIAGVEDRNRIFKYMSIKQVGNGNFITCNIVSQAVVTYTCMNFVSCIMVTLYTFGFSDKQLCWNITARPIA